MKRKLLLSLILFLTAIFYIQSSVWSDLSLTKKNISMSGKVISSFVEPINSSFNNVVWTEHNPGEPVDIFDIYFTQIGSPPKDVGSSTGDRLPSIAANLIAFFSHESGSDYTLHVREWGPDFTIIGPLNPVVNAVDDPTGLALAGNKIAWTTANGLVEYCEYNSGICTNQTVLKPVNGNSAEIPNINGNIVTWKKVDSADGSHSIVGIDVTDPTLTIFTIFDERSNPIFDYDISGDRLIWAREDNFTQNDEVRTCIIDTTINICRNFDVIESTDSTFQLQQVEKYGFQDVYLTFNPNTVESNLTLHNAEQGIKQDFPFSVFKQYRSCDISSQNIYFANTNSPTDTDVYLTGDIYSFQTPVGEPSNGSSTNYGPTILSVNKKGSSLGSIKFFASGAPANASGLLAIGKNEVYVPQPVFGGVGSGGFDSYIDLTQTDPFIDIVPVQANNYGTFDIDYPLPLLGQDETVVVQLLVYNPDLISYSASNALLVTFGP